MSKQATGSFFVDDRGAASAGAAVSIAQNRAMRTEGERSFYVRDATGVALFRVDRCVDGVVRTFRLEATS